MADGSVQENVVDTGAKIEEKPSWLVRILSWIALGGKGAKIEEETLKVGEDFIMKVLPHRGRWRLIDRAEITSQKVIGFYAITHEACEGHAIGDNAVLPGVLLTEMANQLLGVWYATQHPEFIGAGKVLFARRGDYKASRFIKPGDLVQIEVNYADLSGSMTTTRRGTLMELTGKNFLIKVGKELKGSVPLVELTGLEPPKTTPPTT